MPREGLKLEKKEVREIIDLEIEKHDISIGEKEEKLISEIVASCPSSPNTTHLLVWCNKKVSEELDKYPDMNEDIQEIRNAVGKELRYKLDEKRFKEVKERIDFENPETINPQWIRDRFYPLSLSIRRGYKKIDGSVDWDFISNKLGIKDKFSAGKRESWNSDKDKIINALNDLLEEKNPIVFGSDWIDKYGHGIHHQLRLNFKTDEGKTDWNTIKSFLPEKWKERWNIERKNVSILKIAEKIIRTFELEKPEKISPKWIWDRLKNDYKNLTRILPRNGKELNYQVLLDLLPENIVKCWKPFLKIEKIIPKEQYLNSDETDAIINKYKDKIYTFYAILDKEKDRGYRENIIKEMIGIIMKGNIDTLERLMEHLLFMVEGWIENDPRLKIWSHAQQELKEVIKRCVYRFDPAKGKFSSYLYVTLERQAIALKINSKGENLIRKYVDGNIEYHESN